MLLSVARASWLRCGDLAPSRRMVSPELRKGSSRGGLGVGDGEWRGESEGAQPRAAGGVVELLLLLGGVLLVGGGAGRGARPGTNELEDGLVV